ncbi:MAG: hypothetical protein FIA91_02690 [Geobacter sp.]|nr:hypothetical protein [Geobacter sp.]
MKRYSIHFIYPVVFGIFLIIGADTSIHEFLDPKYHVISRWYMPRALMWYIFAYGWFKYFTTVYKVEVEEDGVLRLKSIIKTQFIKFSDVIAINEGRIFVNIVHANGTTSITKLIDGVSNISIVIKGACQPYLKAEKPQISPTKRILKIIIILLLAAYAVYVEVEQVRLYTP